MPGSYAAQVVNDTPTPSFEIDLPAGWRRHPVTDGTLNDLLAILRKRCLEQQRPDLFAHLKNMLERSFSDMTNSGVIAYFCPTVFDDDTVVIPASINATIRTAGPGDSLDDLVRSMISHHGAQPLLGDRRTVRLERQREMNSAEGSVINHSVVYLTPVPGTNRTQALQLVAVFPRDPAESETSFEIEATRALFDACVSTLRWQPEESTDFRGET